jgi:hypothetical protein
MSRDLEVEILMEGTATYDYHPGDQTPITPVTVAPPDGPEVKLERITILVTVEAIINAYNRLTQDQKLNSPLSLKAARELEPIEVQHSIHRNERSSIIDACLEQAQKDGPDQLEYEGDDS